VARVEPGSLLGSDVPDPEFSSEAPVFPNETRPERVGAEVLAFPNESLVEAFVPPSAAEATGLAAPEVFSPAIASGGSPQFRLPAPAFRPQSFVELLDASLALRG
jgi:hypothetical protein